MIGTRIKIIIGYVLLAAVLLLVVRMTYDNTQSLAAVNQASAQLIQRRDIVDSLVCSMLNAANAERSVMQGDKADWSRFDEAINTSVHKIDRLSSLMDSPYKQQRLDSLKLLLQAKRQNTLLVMAELNKQKGDDYYNNKVAALHSGRDSVVVHHKVKEQHQKSETVIEVEKSKRGFFRRLGDAFRKQHTDTVGTTYIDHTAAPDTIDNRVNLADTVAQALTEIHHLEQQDASKRHQKVNARYKKLQRVSILLARRTAQLLEDIQNDEHTALRQAIDRAVSSRNEMIGKIALLGLLSIVTATVLIIYTLRDIRRERRSHKRLAEAKAETELLMEQRERLLLTITHDIKAPAASIVGFIDLLAQYIHEPKAQGYLQNIQCSAKHLLELVTALLDYHQLEKGTAAIHTASFAPYILINECVAEMQPQAMAKGLSLVTDIRIAENLLCCSDAFRIRQVVSNLISNAIKYTDNGKVAVRADMSNIDLTIRVSDTGCGMTDEEQQRIFHAFTRLPDAQGKEGVGLGLSIAQEIAERLGGEIKVESVKGKGSTFTICLPVEGVTKSPSLPSIVGQEDRNTTERATQEGSAQEVKVLIVDDDKLQLQLLTEMFRQISGATFRVLTTQHASDVVRLAEEAQPDLIFTDMEMPEMSGTELLHLLHLQRRDVPSLKAKVVAMTAHDPSILPTLRHEGFAACLFKPFNVPTLAATLTQVLGVLIKGDNVPASTFTSANDLRLSLHQALLPFTDGDAEAEEQIVASIKESVTEYRQLLSGADDAERLSHVVHKAMPLMEMLFPGENDWLMPLTPEQINDTPREEQKQLAKKLEAQLEAVEVSLFGRK